MTKTVKGHYWQARMLSTIVGTVRSCAPRNRTDDGDSGTFRPDNPRLEYVIDIAILIAKNDKSKYLIRWLSGERWDDIPYPFKRKLARDIKNLKADLRAGLYRIE